MELTISQVLKKGIEANKGGEVQKTERDYTTILKAIPSILI